MNRLPLVPSNCLILYLYWVSIFYLYFFYIYSIYFNLLIYIFYSYASYYLCFYNIDIYLCLFFYYNYTNLFEFVFSNYYIFIFDLCCYITNKDYSYDILSNSCYLYFYSRFVSIYFEYLKLPAILLSILLILLGLTL